MPKISIIIRTKNEARHLEKVFEALKNQTFQNFEIIIVDSWSTDETLDIVKKYREILSNRIKIIDIKPEEFTYPSASNIGAKNSSGEYLIYMSGHSVPVSNIWIEDGLKDFTNDNIAGVYCQPVYPLSDASLFEKLICFVGRFVYKGKKIVKKPAMGCMGATNCMIRKNLWKKYNFNTSFANGGEDSEWISYWMEKGYVAVRDFKFSLAHTHGLGPIKYFKQYLHWIKSSKPSRFKYKKHKFN